MSEEENKKWEDYSIDKKLNKLLEEVEKTGKNKEKKFKFPFFTTLGAKGKIKKGYVIVQKIMTNGSVKFKMVRIDDNTVNLDGLYYDAGANHILKYKKYPMIIIPEWNIEPISKDRIKVEEEPEEPNPFSPAEDYREAERKGTLSAPQRTIIAKMKADLIKKKSSINFKAIIIIIILLGVGYYALNYFKVI